MEAKLENLCGVTLEANNGLSLVTNDGLDITPKAQKERALLALLAASDKHKRSRAWLCDKLWSDRSQEQALASLRRALCNIRKTAGDHAECVIGTRYDVSLADFVTVDCAPETMQRHEFLEDIRVRDTGFETWRQALRNPTQVVISQIEFARPVVEPTPRTDAQSEIEIRIIEVFSPEKSEEAFLQSLLIDGLSSRFSNFSDDLNISRCTASETPETRNRNTIEISVESLVVDGNWCANIRATFGEAQAFVWSGSMSIELDFGTVCNGPKLGAFISQATSAIIIRYQNKREKVLSQFLQLHSASARLFTGQRSDILRAQEELSYLPMSGVTLAWRAFGKLTEAIEFAEHDSPQIEASLELARRAVEIAPDNPLVLALSAQVHMKLSDDPEYGIFLAEQAHQQCEYDPYVLHARSQALFFQSDVQGSRFAAHQARECAASLPNSYCWDFQSALAELGLGNLDEAKHLTKQAHLKMPTYRPALRYLLVLAILENDKKASELFATKLKKIEPNFKMSDLLEPNYPVQTLRMSGLLQSIQPNLPSDPMVTITP